MFDKALDDARHQLKNHTLYGKINTMERLAAFMEAHVFAVWDFMSLAKRLQLEFTSLSLPWAFVQDARAARFINEIILYEESDKDQNGIPCSHLEMYLAAMREISADTSRIENLLFLLSSGTPWEQALEDAQVPDWIQDFVKDTLAVAQEGSKAEVASYFLFGREDAIPEMFSALLDNWGVAPDSVPSMTYYLERHIQLDGDEHGPAAESLLKQCIHNDPVAEQAALSKAQQAIASRIRFWDALEQQLDAMPEGSKSESSKTLPTS